MTPRRAVSPLASRLVFDNKFVRHLSGDRIAENFRRQVRGACYSRVLPTPVAAPEMVAWSGEAASLIGLDDAACRSEEFTRVFTGNLILPGMDPFAMCYGGHQFGNWAGQLGDGRAINLGEVINSEGERWMLQLKGAGPTPYSRTADGLAVLRSSIREFLCSEAMHHLGIPTTRALSLTLTGEPVERDMFYDGHPKEEPGAVVCRLSPSFTRFGNFQILAARQETALLKTLMDYTIETDYPHLDTTRPDLYLTWFREVCDRTMDLMVHWMRVGFVHGVMNTDNMSILGLTIDYGPYGWLDNYDPDWTPNTTDASGRRYRYKNQPAIALWNLAQLANAILPVIGDTAPLQEILDGSVRSYQEKWMVMMAGKLGLAAFDPETDPPLFTALLDLLGHQETDYTLFFRGLAEFQPDPSGQTGLPDFLIRALYAPGAIKEDYNALAWRWLNIYARRLERDGLDPARRRQRMNRVNPWIVLRNVLAQQAIDRAEQGDFSEIRTLLEIIRRPYEDQEGKESYTGKRPEWARHRPGCSMLSCSS